MLIEIKGRLARVNDKLGRALIALGRAKAVQNYQTRVMVAEPVVETEEVEISERTGKPKRRYRRRDMQAEDK